jgi:hypothetical protein
MPLSIPSAYRADKPLVLTGFPGLNPGPKIGRVVPDRAANLDAPQAAGSRHADKRAFGHAQQPRGFAGVNQ